MGYMDTILMFLVLSRWKATDNGPKPNFTAMSIIPHDDRIIIPQLMDSFCIYRECQHLPRFFISAISLDSHNSVEWARLGLLFPVYRWEPWRSERLMDLPEGNPGLETDVWVCKDGPAVGSYHVNVLYCLAPCFPLWLRVRPTRTLWGRPSECLCLFYRWKNRGSEKGMMCLRSQSQVVQPTSCCLSMTPQHFLQSFPVWLPGLGVRRAYMAILCEEHVLRTERS